MLKKQIAPLDYGSLNDAIKALYVLDQASGQYVLQVEGGVGIPAEQHNAIAQQLQGVLGEQAKLNTAKAEAETKLQSVQAELEALKAKGEPPVNEAVLKLLQDPSIAKKLTGGKDGETTLQDLLNQTQTATKSELQKEYEAKLSKAQEAIEAMQESQKKQAAAAADAALTQKLTAAVTENQMVVRTAVPDVVTRLKEQGFSLNANGELVIVDPTTNLPKMKPDMTAPLGVNDTLGELRQTSPHYFGQNTGGGAGGGLAGGIQMPAGASINAQGKRVIAKSDLATRTKYAEDIIKGDAIVVEDSQMGAQ